jgi:hypothetical protein
LFLGGKVNLDEAEIGRVIGRFPAKNGVAVMELLLDLFQKEQQDGEDFSACIRASERTPGASEEGGHV